VQIAVRARVVQIAGMKNSSAGLMQEFETNIRFTSAMRRGQPLNCADVCSDCVERESDSELRRVCGMLRKRVPNSNRATLSSAWQGVTAQVRYEKNFSAE
jgi:hypothetical protein